MGMGKSQREWAKQICRERTWKWQDLTRNSDFSLCLHFAMIYSRCLQMASVTGRFYPLKNRKPPEIMVFFGGHWEGCRRAGYQETNQETLSSRKAMAQTYLVPGSETDREVMTPSIMPRQLERHFLLPAMHFEWMPTPSISSIWSRRGKSSVYIPWSHIRPG